VSRTVSKSSHLYLNSTWDLVDALNDKNFSFVDLKESDLPAELKGKTKSEIKVYVTKKKQEREDIQKNIQDLNEKRRVYIQSQQKENDNGLESAMIKAIKTQAKAKKYKW
jgi:hypothetical protein